MFKKFKDKLAEEMKQSPARLQASMQQLAQAVVSPAPSNSSIQDLSQSNDNFRLTEECETPKNSPMKQGFHNVDLMSPISNSIEVSRTSSVTSLTSDTASLFPAYESPSNVYHLQSDMDQSASEIDDNISAQLDRVSKDQLYSAYLKMQAKYNKYRGRFMDLATHYRDLERANVKLEAVLVETQDKVLRRVADLKEQCQLEQQAKAHLEEVLRNDIEEKDHVINTLNTKIKLLQLSGSSAENTANADIQNEPINQKADLIDLNNEASANQDNTFVISTENAQLKEKVKKLEILVLKCKDSLKKNKEKCIELTQERDIIKHEYKEFRELSTKELDNLQEKHDAIMKEVKELREQIIIMKKREEESVISLAENKLSVHRELEGKEEQIKKLNDELNEVVTKYKAEIEKRDLATNKSLVTQFVQCELQKDEDLVEKLEIATKKVEYLNSLVQSLKTELDESRNKLIQKEENYMSLCSELEEHKIMLKDAKEEIITQHEEINELQQRISTEIKDKSNEFELEKQLNDTVEQKSKLEKEIEEYKEEMKEVRNRLVLQNELEIRNSKLEAENNNLQLKIQELEDCYQEAGRALDDLKKMKEKLDVLANVECMNQELQVQINELKNVEANMNSLSSQLNETQQMYNDAMEIVESLKSNNAKYEEQEGEILNLKSQLTSLQEQCNKKDLDFKSLLEKYTNTQHLLDNINKESDNYKQSIEKYLNNIATLNQDYQTLLEKHEKVTTDLNKSNQYIQEILIEKNLLLEKVEEINEKNNKLTQKLEIQALNLKTENETIFSDLKNAKEEIIMLKKENDNVAVLKSEILSLSTTVKQLEEVKNIIILENDTLNEKLKSFNESLSEKDDILKAKMSKYENIKEKYEQEIIKLQKTINNYEHELGDQLNKIQSLSQQLEEANEFRSISMDLNVQMNEFKERENKLCKSNEILKKENEDLNNEVLNLNSSLSNTKSKLEACTLTIDDLTNHLNKLSNIEKENELIVEIDDLKQQIFDYQILKSENKKLMDLQETYTIQSKKLEDSNLLLKKLQSHITTLESKIASLESVEMNNNILNEKISDLSAKKNLIEATLSSQVADLIEEKKSLVTEIMDLKNHIDKEIDTLNTDKNCIENNLLSQISVLTEEKQSLLSETVALKNELSDKDKQLQDINRQFSEKAEEMDQSNNSLVEFEKKISQQQSEIESLKTSNKKLQDDLDESYKKSNLDYKLIEKANELEDEKKRLEAQLDEALITFQAKETHMHMVNDELKNKAHKFKEDLETNEQEQSMRLKQLVKEFQAQLHDKEKELQAALEKRFEHQQNYESNLIHQYKEQLKDYQIELTTKSEQIECLITEKKEVVAKLQKEVEMLKTLMDNIKREHTTEIKDIEEKWRSIMKQKTEKLSSDHENEISELTKEWQNERKDLESTSRVAMAAIETNTGSFHTLQQTLISQRQELDELRKLVRFKHDTLDDSTEIEYLRNILFEYMMGRETMVLARVIAAVVKFDQEQTIKVLKKEEDKLTLLGSLGLS
ncbi:golgin subfamily A member 4-like isoform X2 [Prorops nasuta]|uniref:golgin subfamily A member 4-like isoform X2 n=1 Tax=Prorops nasuta TaxID=863751 RepID=UPI0034CDDA10